MIVLDVFIDSILHKHGYMAVSEDSDCAVILPLYIILIIILANTAVIDVLFKKKYPEICKKILNTEIIIGLIIYLLYLIIMLYICIKSDVFFELLHSYVNDPFTFVGNVLSIID